MVAVVTFWRSYWTVPQMLDQEVAAVSFDLRWPLIIAIAPPLMFFIGAFLWHRRAQRS